MVQEFCEEESAWNGKQLYADWSRLFNPRYFRPDQGILLQSHALGVFNMSLGQFSYNIPYDTCFDNDANNAAYAEITDKGRNTIYLSLNDTVGGAIYIDGHIYRGDHYKSGEFGHMVIVPNGSSATAEKGGLCRRILFFKGAKAERGMQSGTVF